MLFKKDFDNYKMRLTVKACVYYEQLTGNSFLAFGGPLTTEDDALALLYSCFITSNSVTLTFQTFKVLYGDEKFANWANNAFAEAMAMHQQFNIDRDDDEPVEETEDGGNEEVDVRKATITNLATYLVTNSGLSAEYVMNEMQLFEIKAYMKAIDAKEKSRLLEKRLWTYLTIAPHIDCKKIKSPQKLLPFEWEKSEIKQRELDELRRNKENTKQIVGMDLFSLFGQKNNTETTEDNGGNDERGDADSVRPSDIQEGDAPTVGA